MIKLGVVGITGRMGQLVEKLTASSDEFTVVYGIERLSSVELLNSLVRESDVIVDFSQPEGTLNLLSANMNFKKPLVIGTTGLSESEIGEITLMSKHAPVFYSPNMSVGVAVLAKLVKEANALLGERFDVEIVESHHRYKRDAPSGTALKLAEILKPREVPIHSLRAGGIIGTHAVQFVSDEEEIILSHGAMSRYVFARGALAAAKWILNQNPGLYDMDDLLTT
jgi:4-hydroxy-tetrahydrodipicolinate reductase